MLMVSVFMKHTNSSSVYIYFAIIQTLIILLFYSFVLFLLETFNFYNKYCKYVDFVLFNKFGFRDQTISGTNTK